MEKELRNKGRENYKALKSFQGMKHSLVINPTEVSVKKIKHRSHVSQRYIHYPLNAEM